MLDVVAAESVWVSAEGKVIKVRESNILLAEMLVGRWLKVAQVAPRIGDDICILQNRNTSKSLVGSLQRVTYLNGDGAPGFNYKGGFDVLYPNADAYVVVGCDDSRSNVTGYEFPVGCLVTVVDKDLEMHHEASVILAQTSDGKFTISFIRNGHRYQQVVKHTQIRKFAPIDSIFPQVFGTAAEEIGYISVASEKTFDVVDETPCEHNYSAVIPAEVDEEDNLIHPPNLDLLDALFDLSPEDLHRDPPDVGPVGVFRGADKAHAAGPVEVEESCAETYKVGEGTDEEFFAKAVAEANLDPIRSAWTGNLVSMGKLVSSLLKAIRRGSDETIAGNRVKLSQLSENLAKVDTIISKTRMTIGLTLSYDDIRTILHSLRDIELQCSEMVEASEAYEKATSDNMLEAIVLISSVLGDN